MEKISIRNARIEDLVRIVEIDNERYSKISKAVTSNTENMRMRLRASLEWFFVAEVNGRVMGFLSLQPTDKKYTEFVSWEESTNHGTLQGTFKDKEKYVYGVALTVSEEAKNLDIGTKLLISGGEKIIRENKAEAYFSGRMPMYHKYMKKMSAKDYYNKKVVLKGKTVSLDPQIRMYESFGLKKVRLVENGFIGDKESCNYGVVFLARNIFYNWPFPMIWSKLFRLVASNDKLIKYLVG